MREFTIIGAGPVSLVAAIEIATKGHKVKIFEKKDTLTSNFESPFVINLNSRTIHCLRSIDLALEKYIFSSSILIEYWRRYYGERLIDELPAGSIYR